MTVRDDFDRLLTVWLDESAGAGVPDYLDETLDGLARIEQRPAWMRPWRWLTMQLAMPRVYIPRSVPILIVIALLMAALIAAALIVGSRPRLPAPFGPASNGQIAYVSDGQLWVASPDGSNARAITSGASTKGVPLWSRDGTKIAFLAYESANPTLMVANADGSDLVTIAPDAEAMRHVSWSPDGRLIAYSRWIDYSGQRDRIFLGTSDGATDPRQIGDPDLSALYPAFSPDSRQLAFVSDLCCPSRDGKLDFKYCGASDCVGDDNLALQVMSVDGTGITRLAHGTIQPWLEIERYARVVDWRPDGSSILFTGHDITTSQKYGIYAVMPDGSSVPRRVDTGSGVAYGGSFSPDGSRIAFIRGDGQKWDVVISDPDGGEPTVRASDVARFGPQWSPDGRSVAFVDKYSGTDATLRIVPVDGGRAVVVPFRIIDPTSLTEPGVDAIAWQRVAH